MRVAISLWSALGLVVGVLSAAPERAADDEQTLRDAKVATDGAALIDYFKKRTLPDVDAGKIETLTKQLGADDFLTRERASARLVALRTLAIPFLEQAARDKDIEVARRAEECLRRIGGSRSTAVDLAAVRVLAARKPAGAAEVLLGFLPFAGNERVADEVQKALTALAVRDGKSDPALLDALRDKQALKRSAAALALHQSGAADARPAVRKLLGDPDPGVRFGVAMLLMKDKDKEAVPALISAVPDLSWTQAWQVEDILMRLADKDAPGVTLGTDAAGRKKCRDAWADWWTKHGAAVDLAKLDPPKLLGHTMLVFLDDGKVREVDAAGKKLWEISGIEFPLDAQLLPNGNLMSAEYRGNRVTERNKKGEVVWEHKLLNVGPLVGQRLASGNTFIATETSLFEVNKLGKEVFSYVPPSGAGIRKAMRLANGDIVLVNTAGTFQRLTPAGKEILSFPVEVSTNGGRIDVTPAGHVVVPQLAAGKVVEYDTAGRPVWEAAIEEPIAAVRLPNGNTLVTTLNQRRAVEFDRTGREVWDYKGESRVTRAFRR